MDQFSECKEGKDSQHVTVSVSFSYFSNMISMLDHARPVLGGPNPTIGPPVPMGAPGIEEAASALVRNNFAVDSVCRATSIIFNLFHLYKSGSNPF